MNKTSPVTILSLSLFCLGLFLVLAAPIPVEAGAPEVRLEPVRYDAASDRLTVEVQDVSLGKLLRQIALRSGLDILMDPETERQVSAQFKDQPLEIGLKQILRGTSYMMIYRKPEVKGTKNSRQDTTPLLISVKVLPQGKQDSGQLKSVATVMSRGMARAMDRNRAATRGTVDQAAYRESRWMDALDRMTPERREEVETAMVNHEKRLTESRMRREEARARSIQRRAERQARRQAIEDRLSKADPEGYGRKRAEAKAHIEEEIQRRKMAMEQEEQE